MYDKVDQMRLKTSMSRSGACDYSDTYIVVKGTATVENTAAVNAAPNNVDKKVILKNCAPFIKFISRINNAQIDDAHDIDVVMPIYNIIQKHLEFLWQYCRDEPTINVANGDVEFNAANATNNFFIIKS